MDTITIRSVRPDELPVLRDISIRTFVDSFADQNTKENMDDYISKSRSIEKLIEEYYTPGAEFYFAMSAHTPVGYLKLNTGTAQTEAQDNAIEVERIYVEADYQNQKIGQLLLDFLISKGLQANFDIIWLGVWEHNRKAIRFYERNGFSVFGRHDFHLGSDLQTDLLLKRTLQK